MSRGDTARHSRKLSTSGRSEILSRLRRTNCWLRTPRMLKRRGIIGEYTNRKMISSGSRLSALRTTSASYSSNVRERLTKFKVHWARRHRFWRWWKKRKSWLTLFEDSSRRPKRIFISKSRSWMRTWGELSRKTRIRVWLKERRRQEFTRSWRRWRGTTWSSRIAERQIFK